MDAPIRPTKALIMNFDDFFYKKPSGKSASKCMRLGARGIWLGFDIVVMYEQPPEAFLRYAQEILETQMPQILVPNQLQIEPLDLVGSMRSSNITEALAQFENIEIHGLIATTHIHELVQEFGWQVGGTPLSCIHAVEQLNNKATFQTLAKESGINVPQSVHCEGREEVIVNAVKIYEQWGGAMIRSAISAGGLGNTQITESLLGRASVQEYLENILDEECDQQVVLVEPLYALDLHPAITGEIHPDGTIGELVISERFVESGESVGVWIPANFRYDTALAVLEAAGGIIHDIIKPSGYIGRFDIDFGIYRGEVIAFEVNARMLATDVPLKVAETCGLGKDCVIINNENPPNGVNGQSIESYDLIMFAHHTERSYGKSDAKSRVVITLPSSEYGKGAFCLIASNADTARKAHSLMSDFCRYKKD